MNQDFTAQKKQYLSKKKNRAEGFTWKKKFLHKPWAKKKIRASWKFPIPPPPHHFSNGPSLITYFAYASMCLQMSKMLLIEMVLILHIHEIIYISLKLIIPSESRWKAPGREVYNPVTREALVFPTSIATSAWFSLSYKSVEFGLYPPRLAYKSSSIFFSWVRSGSGIRRFFMFSVAKASERAGARLVSPCKKSH